MDEDTDALRRVRSQLVARSERLRLWSRLAGARMDLLTAQVCPPATADEVADDELVELADLVLGTDPPAAGDGGDRVQALLALRAARRDLARRREHLDDLVCWSTAQLLLEGSAPVAGGGARVGRSGVPGQRSPLRQEDLHGLGPRDVAVVPLALVPPPPPPPPSTAPDRSPRHAAAGADPACDTPA